MELRELGRGGPKLSVVGLGCNNFGSRIQVEGAHRVVHAALDAGITHFDTAEMYGGGQSEEFLGAALGTRRDEVVIATKFSPRPKDEPYTPGVLAARIREAIEGSLRRLTTDRVDLYYQHRPDLDAPVEEALETLDELVRAGKVLYIASSGVSAAQIDEADVVSRTKGWSRFTGTQIEWSLLARAVEESVVPAAVRARIGVVPFFPLASGLLTGKYRRGEAPPQGSRLASNVNFARVATEEKFDKIEALENFAVERGHTITELSINWLLAQSAVTSVIAGATTPEQVVANVAALGWTLSSSDAEVVAAL
jgi:aryl-alcohol dehydrogenase-like predicted oxidoreductase